jgi:hypothetical protein
MFAPLIALGLFSAIVWVIAYAILLVMRKDGRGSVAHRPQDTIARFVAENYGPRFVPENLLPERSVRRL